MSRPGFSIGCTLEENGAVTLDNEAKYRTLKGRLKPGRYILTMERQTFTRSEAQNRYYQGVIVERFAEFTGDTHEDAHEVLKLMCNAKVIIDRTSGVEYTIGGSTAVLNVEEFSAYCLRCQQWIAEHCNGLYIPDPNEDREFAQTTP